MTPLYIEILLHYYSRADDYRDGDLSSPAVSECIENMCSENLLEKVSCLPLGVRGPIYRITERAEALVQMLCYTPFPVLFKEWRKP